MDGPNPLDGPKRGLYFPFLSVPIPSMHLRMVLGNIPRRRFARLKWFIERARCDGWRTTQVRLDDIRDRTASLSDVDAIAVAGGDGTVNACLAFAERLPLLLLPLGTGNDLARSLNIRDIVDSAQLLHGRQMRDIDIGRVRHDGIDELFVIGVGIGMDGLVSRAHARGIPYAVSALNAVFHMPRFEARIVRDDHPAMQQEFISLTVANGVFFGGGFKLAPRALLDDGLLDAVTIRPVRRLRYLRRLWDARSGRHVLDPAVTYDLCRKITIESDEPLPWHLDGEPRQSRRLEIDIIPRARTFYSNSFTM